MATGGIRMVRVKRLLPTLMIEMVSSTSSVIEATSSLVAPAPPAASMVIIVSVVSASVLVAAGAARIVVLVRVALATVVAAATKIVVSVTSLMVLSATILVTIEAIISTVHLIVISRLAIVEARWRLAAAPAETASAALAHSLISLLVLVVSVWGRASQVIESLIVLGSRIRLVFLSFVEGFWADLA